MSTKSLRSVIDHLIKLKNVKGIFTTGTTATGLGPSSDIDLVVIFEKNQPCVKSAYTMIDDRFADIFFFDLDFVHRLAELKKIPANGFEGIFMTWLAQGKIEKDDTGLLTNVKQQAKERGFALEISAEEKRDIWFRINYNFLANTRYFSSEDALYHQALEMRLLYSISELLVGYFTLRDIPWRGEKQALKYFAAHEKEVLDLFSEYCASHEYAEKFRAYEKLFHKVLCGEFRAWDKDFLIVKNEQDHIDETLSGSMHELLQGDRTP